MSVIVLDPGHGGTTAVGGSSSNNATSASGILEKNICLDIAKRIRFSLTGGSAADLAQSLGKDVTVVMTRDDDVNLGLDQRAMVAAASDADIYLSIHCNGFNGSARGTECWIDRKYMQPKRISVPGGTRAQPGPGIPSSGVRNVNVDADAEMAKAVVDAALSAFKDFDGGAKLRKDRYTATHHGEAYTPPDGVKMIGLGTLRDAKLGTSENACRAALLEIEFIDHPTVDALLNGGQASTVRNSLAGKVAQALVRVL